MAQDDEPDRAAILARRARFVAAAIAGLTTTSLASACPCLKVGGPSTDDSGSTSSDGSSTSDDAEDETSTSSSSTG